MSLESYELKKFNELKKFKKLNELNNQRIKKFAEETIKNNAKTQGSIMSINDESVPFIVKINELGLMTTNSQDGIYERGPLEVLDSPNSCDYISEEFECSCKAHQHLSKSHKRKLSSEILSGVEFINKERAYVEGFIERKRLGKIYPLTKGRFKMYIPSISLDGKARGNIPLTLTHRSIDEDWKIFTRYHKTISQELYNKIHSNLYTPSDYFGGGVEGLILPKDEWVLVLFYDDYFGILGRSDKGLFPWLIDVLEKY